ncbi:MAG TPA: FG-GAP-like repeat-containing protein [Aquimonas sp.]|nr:FG-GAP-like repeat-containing protein [Aquimonas sp.]
MSSIIRSRLVKALPLMLALLSPAHALQVGAGNAGAIPDNDPLGRALNFQVSGLTEDVRTVELELALSHGAVGDLDVELTAPNGVARLLIFGGTGQQKGNAQGSRRDLNGTYRFSDAVSGDWWFAATDASAPGALTSGAYRTISRGNGFSFHGGCATHLNAAFGELTPAQANGSWTLHVRDLGAGETGAVASARLFINETNVPVALFASGFEAASAVPATRQVVANHCFKAPSDINGDGLTDAVSYDRGGVFTVTLNPGPGISSSTSSVAIDAGYCFFALDLDFDGDAVSDLARWCEGGANVPASFWLALSTRPGSAMRQIQLGMGSGAEDRDNPVVVGDYDGDGRDDLAVFNQPGQFQPPDTIWLVVRYSATGELRAFPVAFGARGSSTVTAGSDLNGDGIADLVLRQLGSTPPPESRFVILFGPDFTAQRVVDHAHHVVSGFAAGPRVLGSNALTVMSAESGSWQWWSRDIDSFATELQTFGPDAEWVRPAVGDFDGDALLDLAYVDARSIPTTLTYQGTTGVVGVLQNALSNPAAPSTLFPSWRIGWIE